MVGDGWLCWRALLELLLLLCPQMTKGEADAKHAGGNDDQREVVVPGSEGGLEEAHVGGFVIVVVAVGRVEVLLAESRERE